MIVRYGEGEVYDADGERLESVVWADTESGEAMHLVLDAPGNDSDSRPITEILMHPAPLEVRSR